MAALDLFGRRWSLRILWELSRAKAPLPFRALQDAAETNPALLNTRLKELREAAIVLHSGDGYALSEEGESLLKFLLPLADWAKKWAEKSK